MFPSPELSQQGHTIFAVKYNIALQPHLLLFFLTKPVFAASYNTRTVGAAKSSNTSKNMYSKIFTGTLLLVIALLVLSSPERVNSPVCLTLC